MEANRPPRKKFNYYGAYVMKLFLISLVLSLSLTAMAVVDAANNKKVKSVELPDMKPVKLKAYGQLEENAHLEPSGMVKSRTHPNLYWTLNDSGDGARIFPHDRNGKLYNERTEGVPIYGAYNVDWEDMTIDNYGHIIVGDIGNNSQARRDFTLYWVLEPNPVTTRINFLKKVFFTYPDYPDPSELPAKMRNYDSEGIWWANGKVYVVTKNRSDSLTRLYRLDSEKPFEVNTLTYLDSFDVGGRTTAADTTPDGTKVVITTYTAIWLFEVEPGKDNYFEGKISWLPIDTWVPGERMPYGQNETVCFDGDKLIISSGEGAEVPIGGTLYEVPLSDLIVVQEWSSIGVLDN